MFNKTCARPRLKIIISRAFVTSLSVQCTYTQVLQLLWPYNLETSNYGISTHTRTIANQNTSMYSIYKVF